MNHQQHKISYKYCRLSNKKPSQHSFLNSEIFNKDSKSDGNFCRGPNINSRSVSSSFTDGDSYTSKHRLTRFSVNFNAFNSNIGAKAANVLQCWFIVLLTKNMPSTITVRTPSGGVKLLFPVM